MTANQWLYAKLQKKKHFCPLNSVCLMVSLIQWSSHLRWEKLYKRLLSLLIKKLKRLRVWFRPCLIKSPSKIGIWRLKIHLSSSKLRYLHHLKFLHQRMLLHSMKTKCEKCQSPNLVTCMKNNGFLSMSKRIMISPKNFTPLSKKQVSQSESKFKNLNGLKHTTKRIVKILNSNS